MTQQMIRPRVPSDPPLYDEPNGKYVLQAMDDHDSINLDAGQVFDHGSLAAVIQSCFDNASNLEVPANIHFQVRCYRADLEEVPSELRQELTSESVTITFL